MTDTPQSLAKNGNGAQTIEQVLVGGDLSKLSTAGAQAYKTFERRTARQAETMCATCGRALFVMPSTLRAVNFCNHACTAEWKKTRRAELAGGWRGGILRSGGRIYFYCPGHHLASAAGYVSLHRWSAEKKLGRRLLPGEVVHHINGCALDDDPDNLEVFASEAEHQRLHGKVRGGLNRGQDVAALLTGRA